LADDEEPPPKQPGKPKNTRGRNLLNRLTAHQGGWLAFAFTEDVPFSDNQAERDIRCLKTKTKGPQLPELSKVRSTMRASSPLHQPFGKHSMNVFRHLIDVLDRKDIVFSGWLSFYYKSNFLNIGFSVGVSFK
jgi:hypothetical protein